VSPKKNNNKKQQQKTLSNNVSVNFSSVWWKCCMMFACQFDNNFLRCFCLKGFVIAIVKTKVYRHNEQRSELVYRVELLQQARLRAGTK
jgi:hypothetical protein